MRKATQLLVGVALILDGLAGYYTDTVAVIVGLVLVGAVSIEGAAALIGGRRTDGAEDRPAPPT